MISCSFGSTAIGSIVIGVITVGVDLAAEPKGTAVASIDWSGRRAVVRDLVIGADDARVVSTVASADKVGIDCPLGWPVPFVEFISGHRAGHVAIPPGGSGRDWRRTLAYRATDEAVHQLIGLHPLSVAADRIGHTAMRCAALLAQLEQLGQPVDRCGFGAVVEVYPAASLRQWRLPHRGYKGPRNAAVLAGLLDALLAAAPWLGISEFDSLCRRSDHAIDAVVASLTARAAFLSLTTTPPPEQAGLAAAEGWIAVPTSPLSELSQAANAARL